MGATRVDIIDKLLIEAQREPHEPIWRDAMGEVLGHSMTLHANENRMGKPMKKALKSIAKSMKVLEECQMRSLENWNESIWMQKQNLGINNEVLAHSRDASRIMLKRFELEHKPFVSVLEGLLELIPADLGRQEPVEEAKRLIKLMKVKP